MVYNLVAKYGIVPQGLYPDSFSAGASSTLNSILFTKLREYALVLQHFLFSSSSSSSSSLSETKAKVLREIHTILTLTLGHPQSAEGDFTWETPRGVRVGHLLAAVPRHRGDTTLGPEPGARARARLTGARPAATHEHAEPCCSLDRLVRHAGPLDGRSSFYPGPSSTRPCEATRSGPCWARNQSCCRAGTRWGAWRSWVFSFRFFFLTSPFYLAIRSVIQPSRAMPGPTSCMPCLDVDEATGIPRRYRISGA
ncbi:hypothetical protein L209DRAFT_758681 [Thermothelomyces heterothallicus CBS 203.75]